MKGRQRDTMGGRLQLPGVMGEGIDLGEKKKNQFAIPFITIL